MAGDLKALLIKLYKDPKFRRTFADNPSKALAAEGFDTSNLSVPKKVKLADLEEQMLAETPSKDDGRALTLDEISKFSDQRILKHYGSKIQPHDSAINEENPPLFLAQYPPSFIQNINITPVAVYAVPIATIAAVGNVPKKPPKKKPGK
jgi:hypothetical protein